jgi:cytochrome subunit of sulfide dehydrogenase
MTSLCRLGLTLAGALFALPAPAQSPAPSTDPHLARNLAATCANCHGTDGRAQAGAAALAGYPADKLITAMAAFKAGQRPATIMHQIAKGYTDAQIAQIASHFAQQKP